MNEHASPNGSIVARFPRHELNGRGPLQEPLGACDPLGAPSGERAPPELEIIRASSLDGKPIPSRRWLVHQLIPEANVTLLGGDGGTGKSLLALQLCAAKAVGGEWLGYTLAQGKSVFLSAEDEIDELHRRLFDINPRLAELDDLLLVPVAGKDAILAVPESRDGLLRETPLFGTLKRLIESERPTLLVLDTLADLFGGDEIKKVQARQFIAMLRGLALDYDVAIVLLSHPSLSGIQSGSGRSGNVAWNNSVRSRLYFERDGEDADLRVLETKKANRAAAGGKIFVRYVEGRFVREDEQKRTGDLEREAKSVFLSLLKQFERENRMVSHSSTSGNYAPKIFAQHPNANSIGKTHFVKAMNTLFEERRIEIAEYGPPSRRCKKLALKRTVENEP